MPICDIKSLSFILSCRNQEIPTLSSRYFLSFRKGSTADQIMMITMSTNRNTKIIPNKWMSLITCRITETKYGSLIRGFFRIFFRSSFSLIYVFLKLMVVLSAKSKLNDHGKVSDRGYFVELRERH